MWDDDIVEVVKGSSARLVDAQIGSYPIRAIESLAPAVAESLPSAPTGDSMTRVLPRQVSAGALFKQLSVGGSQMQIDSTDQSIRAGQTAYDTGTGFWVGIDDTTPKLSIGNSAGNKLTWNGTTLSITGTLTATVGTIGGWTIGATALTSGSGATTVGLDSGGTNPALYAGNATPASAPFRVTNAGALTATNATITGSVTATSGTIGGFSIGSDYVRDAANSFGLASTVTGGDDVRFWAGDTFANRATAPFRATEAGAVTASNLSVTGGSISGAGIVSVVALNVANRGWTQTSSFTVTDADTVAWTSGTFVTADGGTTYSIVAGNTGNMTTKTYIYLDIAVSTTVYQTTTTLTTAVGTGKVLIAVAQNNENEASFAVLEGMGSQNIPGGNIITSSITANEIASGSISTDHLAANSVTATKLAASITYTGSLIVSTSGAIRSGQTDFDTGTGWFLGDSSGTAKFSIGSSTNKLTWDGTYLRFTGALTLTDVLNNIAYATASLPIPPTSVGFSNPAGEET